MKFRAPLYVAWEITQFCNARCLHCYSNSSPDVSRSNELNTEEAIEVIDQLAGAGLMVLAFSGGEPFLRQDWRKLAQHAKELELVVNFGSNGACITPSLADEIAQLGIDSITISIDSHLPDVHDNFRQMRGLHSKALKAVTVLRQRGIRVVVGFTPTKLNWHHGKDVVKLALEIGASAANLSEYVPSGRGGQDLALPPEQLQQVLHEWIDLRKKLDGRIEVIWHDCRVATLVPSTERRNYLGCGAGRFVARILPDGTVTPCVFLPTPIGSLREHSFAEIWEKSTLMSQFRNRDEISGNCGACDHLHNCGGCRAVAYSYSGGDPLAGDPHCWIESDNSSENNELLEGEKLPV
jgi:AdoMet-dependent heme synthase